jgi:hypothetical protein
MLNQYLRDELDYLKARPVARVSDLDGTVSNTTSTSFVDITGASVSITTSGSSRLLITGHVMWGNSGVYAGVLTVLIDGVNVGDATNGVMSQNSPATAGSPAGSNNAFSWITTAAVADGAHTVKLQYRTQNAAGTLTVYGFVLNVAEVY